MNALDLILILRVGPQLMDETIVGVAVVVAIVGGVSVPQAVELAVTLRPGFLDDLCIASLGDLSRWRTMPVTLRPPCRPLEVLTVKTLHSARLAVVADHGAPTMPLTTWPVKVKNRRMSYISMYFRLPPRPGRLPLAMMWMPSPDGESSV